MAEKSAKMITVNEMTGNPNKLWDILKVKQKQYQNIEPLSHDTPIDPTKLRCVCMSDTHNRTSQMHMAVPDGDIFIHAGDFSMVGHPKEVAEFNEFLANLPHRRKVVIAGNHDLPFDPLFMKPENSLKLRKFGVTQEDVTQELTKRGFTLMKEMLNCKNLVYLEDSLTKICGLTFYGSPWQPEFCDWGFNLPRGQPCLDKWNLIPEETDILITHGPPLGYKDHCYDGFRSGCAELLATIQTRVKPKYHIFGHIHEDYGVATDGCTTYINASTCSLRYKPTQQPIIFDIDIPAGFSKEELEEDISANTGTGK